MLAKYKKKGAVTPQSNLTNSTNLPNNDTDTNIDNFLFDLQAELEPENILISIQGKTCLSTQNVMVISGKPKSRKSALAHAVIGAAIKKEPVLGIECNLMPADEIVLIDTEQSKHDLKRSLDRMQRQTGLDKMPAYFKCYTVRQLNPFHVKNVIKKICENEKTRLIIIDGALDLILNMNDIIEVKETIDFIKVILSEKNVGLVFIIHQSKSTNFTIGHLGSYFDRFAQTVIEVTKLENGNSEVKAQMMRSDENFKSYDFYWNFNTNNYSINWVESLEVTATKTTSYSVEQHKLKLAQIFNDKESLSYTGFIEIAVKQYQKSEYWCKKLVKELFAMNILEKNNLGLLQIKQEVEKPF